MIASEFYALGLLGYKTAILLLYLRLFGVNKKFKWACWAVMIFNAGYLLSNIFLQIFSCSPVQKFFQKDLPGHCVGLIPPDIAWGAMSMLSDLAIAILPLHVVWHLHLNRRERILLSLVFLSGIMYVVQPTNAQADNVLTSMQSFWCGYYPLDLRHTRLVGSQGP